MRKYNDAIYLLNTGINYNGENLGKVHFGNSCKWEPLESKKFVFDTLYFELIQV